MYSPHVQRQAAGFSLAEALTVLLVLGLAATLTLPALAAMHRRAGLRTATGRIVTMLTRCRAFAILQSTNSAVVFDQVGPGRWRITIASDGDGDGVRRDDLARGRDLVVGLALELEAGTAGPGILGGVRVPDPSSPNRPLPGDLADPIRAGNADMISFSPQGNSTAASVYLTDHRDAMRVIRVYGVSGRVRVMEWRAGDQRWRRVTW